MRGGPNGKGCGELIDITPGTSDPFELDHAVPPWKGGKDTLQRHLTQSAQELSKGAMFMIHKAWTGMWGDAVALRKDADLLDKIDSTLAETYAAKTDQPLEDVSGWMVAKTSFTAQEALEAGFADSIAEAEAKACAWNLSVCENAPKTLAPNAAAPAAVPVTAQAHPAPG